MYIIRNVNKNFNLGKMPTVSSALTSAEWWALQFSKEYPRGSFQIYKKFWIFEKKVGEPYTNGANPGS